MFSWLSRFWRKTPGTDPGRNGPPGNSETGNIDCPQHGWQGIGLVCEHIAFAVDAGEQIGFYYGDETDTARPDAWCARCEDALIALNGASSEQWFLDGQYKIFCAACWDEACLVCGGGGPWPGHSDEVKKDADD